jgi:hypothetical protein
VRRERSPGGPGQVEPLSPIEAPLAGRQGEQGVDEPFLLLARG